MMGMGGDNVDLGEIPHVVLRGEATLSRSPRFLDTGLIQILLSDLELNGRRRAVFHVLVCRIVEHCDVREPVLSGAGQNYGYGEKVRHGQHPRCD